MMGEDQSSLSKGSLAVVIGSGPAGLMAAETLADAGARVIVAEAKPSVGRKFLMAGKSGLNLTKDEPDAAFLRGFYEAAPHMTPMLAAMGPSAVKRFANGLGQETFTGSSGKVFPKVMKASPLLRAWLARLSEKGVEIRTRWQWVGFDPDDGAVFRTANGRETLAAQAYILALGGASWARLGSDGAWTALLSQKGVPLSAFQPANVGLSVNWSELMAPYFGQAVKPVIVSTALGGHRGEFIISKNGLEGSGVYAVCRDVRLGEPVMLDLMPDVPLDVLAERLGKPQGKASMATHLRKTIRLEGAKRALLMEFGRPLPATHDDLAQRIKALPVRHEGPRPMDEAISVAGGVAWDGLDDGLMLKAMPGVFCAGEMLDWEAPTGGYLITGCLATGHWAGQAAARWLQQG